MQEWQAQVIKCENNPFGNFHGKIVLGGRRIIYTDQAVRYKDAVFIMVAAVKGTINFIAFENGPRSADEEVDCRISC